MLGEDKPDIRQALTVKYYTDPKSPTFNNLTQSARKAGFGDTYAKRFIHNQPWVKKMHARHAKLMKTVEKNLEKFATMDTEGFAIIDKEIVQTPFSGEKLRIKADMNKFLASTLGRKDYATKVETEHSGELKVEKLIIDI